MTPLKIQASRLKLVLLLLVSLGFVAGGVFILIKGSPGDAWIGWSTILFFGLGIPIFIYQLLDTRPRLEFNDEGVHDRTLGVGMIPWREIRDARLHSVQGTSFICLELYDPEPWLARLSPVKRAMTQANNALGFSAFNLNLAAVNADPNQLLELVQKMAAAARRDAPLA